MSDRNESTNYQLFEDELKPEELAEVSGGSRTAPPSGTAGQYVSSDTRVYDNPGCAERFARAISVVTTRPAERLAGRAERARTSCLLPMIEPVRMDWHAKR